jgi:hypothetical protein
MKCPLLPLHDQFSPPKLQEKDNEIHISDPSGISFSESQPNLSMDNYNGGLTQKSSGSQVRKRLLALHLVQPKLRKKGAIDYNLTKEQPTPPSLEPEWSCDFNSRKLE